MMTVSNHKVIGLAYTLLLALVVLCPCDASGQEASCSPLSEAKATTLIKGGVTEKRLISLLIRCGMNFVSTPDNRTQFKDVGISQEALKDIEWLGQWELLGTAGTTLQSDTKPSMAGAWTATFSDSLSNGTLHLNIAQSEDGTVRGTYTSSLGGGGTILGTVFGDNAKLQLKQDLENCPGIFKALLELGQVGKPLSGAYLGDDCIGLHREGGFTLSPGVGATSGSGVQPTVVQGSVLELGLARTVFVLVPPEQAAEKKTIEGVLRSKGILLLDDPVRADVVLLLLIVNERPFLLAQRMIFLHNTIRTVWICPEVPSSSLAPGRVPVYCAEQFAKAFAEAHTR